VRLYNAARFEEAAAAFAEALAADPSSTDARKGLGGSWAAAGNAELVKGNWEAARRDLEKAVEAWPGNAGYHLLLAMILFRKGDYDYSRWAVKKALALEPDNPQAHELMGDLLYQEGYLDLAVPEWEKGLPNSPHRRMLEEKLERARKELRVEQGYGREVSRHFILEADSPVPRGVTQAVLADLEEAYDQIRREIGTQPGGDITVIIYSKGVYHEITRTPTWAGGSFDGKIRIPVMRLETPDDARRLKPILAHELAHAFLRSMIPQRIPLWFEEGIAEHFEGASAEHGRAWLQRVPGTRYSTLAEVEAVLQGRGGEVERAYVMAYLAVQTIIDEAGFSALRRMLEDMKAGDSFLRVLESDARMNMPELEERWLRNIP
jgi:hypothetical protein